jgi:probable rRNA maturation factor
VEISLGNAQKRIEVLPENVRQFARAVLEGERAEADEVGIVFIEDAYSRELNARFRGMDRPTDVLAFPLSDDPEADPPGRYLGEVYVNVDRAAAQAEEYGVTLSRELARLLAHGLLHLLGYDHEISAAEAHRMSGREEQYLEELAGLGGELIRPARR